jgi:hypothetical protein
MNGQPTAQLRLATQHAATHCGQFHIPNTQEDYENEWDRQTHRHANSKTLTRSNHHERLCFRCTTWNRATASKRSGVFQGIPWNARMINGEICSVKVVKRNSSFSLDQLGQMSNIASCFDNLDWKSHGLVTTIELNPNDCKRERGWTGIVT